MLKNAGKAVRTVKRCVRTAGKIRRSGERINRIYIKIAAVIAIVSAVSAAADKIVTYTSDSADLVGKFWSQTTDARTVKHNAEKISTGFSLSLIPEWDGKTAYVVVNDNKPYFTKNDKQMRKTILSDLDDLGRCGPACGYLGPESIADGDRGSIGHIKPSGWHTVKYPHLIPDKYLYNRCHLLMWKASGILDDERNLITGTRYLNTTGMLPFEEQLVDYILNTGNHVLYRVTPVFKDDELVARGVLLEARSVEDKGSGLIFCVYCYNVQPGVKIDYATGASCKQRIQ